MNNYILIDKHLNQLDAVLADNKSEAYRHFSESLLLDETMEILTYNEYLDKLGSTDFEEMLKDYKFE